MKDIVFLFRAAKRRNIIHQRFIVSGEKPRFIEQCKTPLTVVHQGIDWSYIEQPKFFRKYRPNVLLRCFTHAEIIARHAPKKYNITCTTEPFVKDSIVIVDCRLVNKTYLLERLKKNRNIVLVDIIDSQLRDPSLALIDGIICCSRKAYEHYSSRDLSCPVFFVEHCRDRRIAPRAKEQSTFKACYFGATENYFAPGQVVNHVTTHFTAVEYKTTQDWLEHLTDASLHYALRPTMEKRVFKPFTKGFVAAACNANILIAADDGDAESYLGSDYPYLIHEPLTEEVVLTYLDKAKTDFGGAEWKRGLDVMRQLNEYVKEETIAKQFWDMVEGF